MSLSGKDRSKTVSNTSGVLMAANTSRESFFIKNDTAIDIWLNLSGPASAVAGNGNFKVEAGGYWSQDEYSGAINAISSGADAAITAWEF